MNGIHQLSSLRLGSTLYQIVLKLLLCANWSPQGPEKNASWPGTPT